MRYSELMGKEIVDISAGMRLGLVAGTDLVIDTATGALVALVIFQRSGWFATQELSVPWDGVKKVGKDIIIVDISVATEPMEARVATVRPHIPRRARHFVPGVAVEEDESASLEHVESDIIEDNRQIRRHDGA